MSKKQSNKKQGLQGPRAGFVVLIIAAFFFVLFMGIYNISNPANELPTLVPSPSVSQTPENTPHPDTILYNIVDEIVYSDVIEAYTNPDVPSVLIRFEMPENNLNVTRLYLNEMFCPIRETGLFGGYTYLIRARGQFVDSFGNDVDEDGFAIRLLPDIVDQVNCDNISSVNWQAIADYYEVHRLINQ